MKVLLINNIHYLRGGSETVYFNTAQILENAGHEVFFFSYSDEKNLPCAQEGYFVKKGNRLSQICQYFYNREAAQKLNNLIDEVKPDIAHIHLIWGGMSPSILDVLHKRGIPIVHTAHDYRMVCPGYLLTDGKGNRCERCKGGKYYQCVVNRCAKGSMVESLIMTAEMYYREKKHHPIKKIDGFVFVSNFSRNKHIEFNPRFKDVSSIVLYNCPGEPIKDSLIMSLDTYSNYYLYFGRLSAEKGVPTLIKAFEKEAKCKLKIVGTGALETELKSYCKERSVANVEFLGYKYGKELFDLVANAKYVCVPSECFENNPMTIVEAYSLKTPVIGAAIGGISEIVENGRTGFTFESGNVDSLTNAINKAENLDKDSYEQLKLESFTFAKENFSREKYLKKLLAFYESLISKTK